jgi:hypothetical protein
LWDSCSYIHPQKRLNIEPSGWAGRSGLRKRSEASGKNQAFILIFKTLLFFDLKTGSNVILVRRKVCRRTSFFFELKKKEAKKNPVESFPW